MQKNLNFTVLLLAPFLLVSLNLWATATYQTKVLPVSTEIQQEMLTTRTYESTCPVSPSRLRVVNISYYDFEGKVHNDGELIVLDAAVDNVLAIFKELYSIKFPIAKLRRIELYNGEEEKSLADNNSCCFQCRSITNKPGIYSLHSYGLAIDINPWQNPYLGYYDLNTGFLKALPPAGVNFINRTNMRPGMLEDVVSIFKKNGFTIWGGKWNDPIDWQHFQTSRAIARLLAVMSPEDAKTMFKLYVIDNQLMNKIAETDDTLLQLYSSSSVKFMHVMQTNFSALNKLEPAAALDLVRKKMSTS